MGFRFGFGWYGGRLFEAVPHAYHQFAHATFGVADLKRLFYPSQRLFGAANLNVQPRRQLLDLAVGQCRFAPTRVDGAQFVDPGSDVGLDLGVDRLGAHLQNGSVLSTIVTGIQKQDCLDLPTAPSLIRLLVALFQILSLAATKGEHFLSHAGFLRLT